MSKEKNKELIRNVITVYFRMSLRKEQAAASYGAQWARYWLNEASRRYGIVFSMAEIEEMKKTAEESLKNGTPLPMIG